LFGKTAKQWRQENPDKKGNIRDFATIEQLLVLTNLENANAIYIQQNMSQAERLRALRNMAVSQIQKLSNTRNAEQLNQLHNQFGIEEALEK
jgi:ABC-type lipoprotein export system ATPase subunit